LEQLEEHKKKIKIDKEKIEVDTIREGFRIIFKQKFFNEWRAAK